MKRVSPINDLVSFGGLVILKSNRAAKERMYRKSFGEVIMKHVDGMSE